MARIEVTVIFAVASGPGKPTVGDNPMTDPVIKYVRSAAFTILDSKWTNQSLYLQFDVGENFDVTTIRRIAEAAVNTFLQEEGREEINWSELWDEMPRKYWKRYGLDLTRSVFLPTADPQKINDEIRKLLATTNIEIFAPL